MIVNSAYYLGIALLGMFVSETLGCLWHRWVAHEGLLRWVANDLLRRAHYHHHESPDGYPRTKLVAKEYHPSCEITFYPLAVLVITILGAVTAMKLITWPVFGAFVGGSLVYAIAGLSWTHTLYHSAGNLVRGHWLLRWVFQISGVQAAFNWLRRYHLVHHYTLANFAILNPVCDWVCGTYVSPSRLDELRKAWREQRGEDLFPGFDGVARGCS